jgi:DNA-binding PadR family transcriptional regulator
VNTLGFAILGLVAARPCTGYDVARYMKKPIGYMWTANHSQIYPELARLESAKLVRSTVIPGRGPRDTKRYTITAAGRRSLQEWVDSPLNEVARSELLLRVRSMWLVSPERARAFIAKQRAAYVERLAVYTEEEFLFAPHAEDLGDPTTLAFAEYATLRFGIDRMRFTIDWCDWLLEQLESAVPDHARPARSEDNT